MTDFTYRCRIGSDPGINPFTWDDVTDRLRETPIRVTYGRADELSTDQPSECNLTLDNRDGHWQTGIDPGTALRLEVNHNGTWHPLFYGLIESAPAGWPDINDATVEVAAVGGMSLLARTDLTITRDQELSGARIAAVLTAAGWPSHLRDIDPGVVLINEVGTDDEPAEMRALELIQRAVEAEQGQLLDGPDGRIVFHDRHSRLDAEPAATFDVSLPPVELEPLYDDMKLYTVGRAEMADGETVEFESATAAVYGRRVFEVRDLETELVEAEAAAAWAVVCYEHPRRRYRTLTLAARGSDALMGAALSLRPNHIVRVKFAPGVGASTDELVCVERVEHREHRGDWRTKFELSPFFGAGPWLVLDSDDPEMVLDGTAKLAP